MYPAQCPGGVWVSANPVCSLQWQLTSLFIPWSVTLSVSASQERAAQPQLPQHSLWSIPKHWKSITLYTLDEVRGLHRARRIPKDNTHLAVMPPDYGAASFSRLSDWSELINTPLYLKKKKILSLAKGDVCSTALIEPPTLTFNYRKIGWGYSFIFVQHRAAKPNEYL